MSETRTKCVQKCLRKREADEWDKVKVALGLTAGSLRHLTAALIERTKNSLSGAGCTIREKSDTVIVRYYRCYASVCKNEVVAIRGGGSYAHAADSVTTAPP